MSILDIAAQTPVGTMVMDGSNNTISVVTATNTGGIRPTPKVKTQDILDQFALNEFVVEHRVQEQELIKLKEQNVDYADAIKENMAKNMARDVVKKISFTKKFEQDTFNHSFRGRCWVFTKEEMINLIEAIKNGV
jgi:hypothetical protein